MINLKLHVYPEFFKEEIRANFTVSSKMKEIWAVELDLFAEFDRICKKYNIKYVASGGTMLGAVRHKGFIPWDDDMDLMMMRDDYEKFCKIAPKEFLHPYFFQTEETDSGFMRGFARLRNSETTGILKKEFPYRPTFNQGIFIDIFPLDNVPDSILRYKIQCLRYNLFHKLYTVSDSIERNAQYHEVSKTKLLARRFLHDVIGGACHYFRLSFRFFNKTQKICKQYNSYPTEKVSLLSFQMHNLHHALNRKDMDDITLLDFEFLKMPVPVNYDEHLSHKYGDYKHPKRISNWHGDVIFDVNRSYVDYYKDGK